MIILSNLLYSLAMLLDMVLGFVVLLVIARAVISWVNPDPMNPIVRFLTKSTDPMIEPIARKLSLRAGGVDFAPIVLILILYFLKFFLVSNMLDYAAVLKPKVVFDIINPIVGVA